MKCGHPYCEGQIDICLDEIMDTEELFDSGEACPECDGRGSFGGPIPPCIACGGHGHRECGTISCNNDCVWDGKCVDCIERLEEERARQ